MRHLILTVGFLLTLPLALSAVESSPEKVVNDAIKALRADDYTQLIVAVAGSLDEARSDWDTSRQEPADSMGDAELNMQLAMLTDPEMTDMLVMQAEASAAEMPSGEELSQTLAMAPMLLMGIAGGNPEIAQAPEMQFVISLLPDLQKWVATANLNDPQKAGAAVRAFATGVQQLGVKSAQDIRDLEFEEFLAKAGQFSATVKETMAIYDIDLNAFLDSIQAESVGDSLALTLTMLGKERQLSMAMIQEDGVWMPKIAQTLAEAQEEPASGFDQGFEGEFEVEEMPAEE